MIMSPRSAAESGSERKRETALQKNGFLRKRRLSCSHSLRHATTCSSFISAMAASSWYFSLVIRAF